MEVPTVIKFFIKKSEEGGYTATAVGYSIYTQGETLDEVTNNIKEAVECYFSDNANMNRSLPIHINFELPSFV